jgi:hypothetical protein
MAWQKIKTCASGAVAKNVAAGTSAMHTDARKGRSCCGTHQHANEDGSKVDKQVLHRHTMKPHA